MTYIKQEEMDKTFRGNKTTKTDRNDRAELIKKGFELFVNGKNNFEYDLKKENEAKYDGADSEASYLSKIVGINLIKTFLKYNKKTDIDEDKTYIFYATEGSGTVSSKDIYFENGKKVSIGFDVMNNPNTGELNNILNNKEELYKLELEKLEEIYHTIGNFTFFPRREIKNSSDIQHIHKNNNENWNKTLKYLEDNWGYYQFNGFCKFEEYIEMSLQQFYTIEGWKIIKEIVDEEELEKLLKDETKLKKLYVMIKDSTSEIYCKTYDKDDVKVINAIIQIRSRIIIMMLRGKL